MTRFELTDQQHEHIAEHLSEADGHGRLHEDHRKVVNSIFWILHTGAGRPPTCDDTKYTRRNVVERCVGRLKECRRIATRFEKKASHYKAMLKWAFIGEYLKR